MPNIFQPQPISAADLAPIAAGPPITRADLNPVAIDQAYTAALAIGNQTGGVLTNALRPKTAEEQSDIASHQLRLNALKKLPPGADALDLASVDKYTSIFGAPLVDQTTGQYDTKGMAAALQKVANDEFELRKRAVDAKFKPAPSLLGASDKAQIYSAYLAAKKSDLLTRKNPITGATEEVPIEELAANMPDEVRVFYTSKGGSPTSSSQNSAGQSRNTAAVARLEVPLINMAMGAGQIGVVQNAFNHLGGLAAYKAAKRGGQAGANLWDWAKDFAKKKFGVGPGGNPDPQAVSQAMKDVADIDNAIGVMAIDWSNMLNPGKSATEQDIKDFKEKYFNYDQFSTNLSDWDLSYQNHKLDAMRNIVKTRIAMYDQLIPDMEPLYVPGNYYTQGKVLTQARLVDDTTGKVVVPPQDLSLEQGVAWAEKNPNVHPRLVTVEQNSPEWNSYENYLAAGGRKPTPAENVPTKRISSGDTLMAVFRDVESPEGPTPGSRAARVTQGIENPPVNVTPEKKWVTGGTYTDANGVAQVWDGTKFVAPGTISLPSAAPAAPAPAAAPAGPPLSGSSLSPEGYFNTEEGPIRKPLAQASAGPLTVAQQWNASMSSLA